MTIKVNIENEVLEWSLNDAIKKMPEGLRPNPFNETTAKTKFIELAISNYIQFLQENEDLVKEVEEFYEAMPLERKRSAVT